MSIRGPAVAILRRPLVAAFIALVVLAAIVEAAVAGGLISPLVVPRPSAVVLAIGKLWTTEDLPLAFAETLAEAVAATALAAAVAIPAGYLMWRFAALGRAWRPWLGALFAAPTVLLYPLFLVFFGRSHVTIVVMGALTAAIPIALYTLDGLRAVRPALQNVGKSFNLRGGQMFWKIQFPAAAPTIFSGLRLGLIYGLVNVIGIEFLIVYGGLGRIVSEMYDNFEFPEMYAGIVFIVIVAFLLFWLLERGESAARSL
ncbi:MAG TPA: ABC transporter permease subunit [Hyphomicrobiales bacterium]|nr:ABC transporter permease subunit [Hyphomicrobiales bacterium]